MTLPLQPVSLERMTAAVELVRNRLLRAAAALKSGGVPYAVVGGNAVAAWVARVDQAAVRKTQDVDILLRREDLEQAKLALAGAGFVCRHVRGVDMFLDGPEAKARDAVHVVFAGEKIRSDYLMASPAVESVDASGEFNVINLEALVQMNLTSFRDKDRVHLRDLCGGARATGQGARPSRGHGPWAAQRRPAQARPKARRSRPSDAATGDGRDRRRGLVAMTLRSTHKFTQTPANFRRSASIASRRTDSSSSAGSRSCSCSAGVWLKR